MTVIRKIRKAIGTLLGGITAGAVIAILKAVGVDVPLELAGAIALALTTFGTWLAPANETA